MVVLKCFSKVWVVKPTCFVKIIQTVRGPDFKPGLLTDQVLMVRNSNAVVLLLSPHLHQCLNGLRPFLFLRLPAKFDSVIKLFFNCLFAELDTDAAREFRLPMNVDFRSWTHNNVIKLLFSPFSLLVTLSCLYQFFNSVFSSLDCFLSLELTFIEMVLVDLKSLSFSNEWPL